MLNSVIKLLLIIFNKQYINFVKTIKLKSLLFYIYRNGRTSRCKGSFEFISRTGPAASNTHRKQVKSSSLSSPS
jgi:hypothetical protein